MRFFRPQTKWLKNIYQLAGSDIAILSPTKWLKYIYQFTGSDNLILFGTNKVHYIKINYAKLLIIDTIYYRYNGGEAKKVPKQTYK